MDHHRLQLIPAQAMSESRSTMTWGKDKCIGGKGKKDTGKSCEKEKKIP